MVPVKKNKVKSIQKASGHATRSRNLIDMMNAIIHQKSYDSDKYYAKYCCTPSSVVPSIMFVLLPLDLCSWESHEQSLGRSYPIQDPVESTVTTERGLSQELVH